MAWRQSPALLVAILALFVALGGSVYAAAKIDGKKVRMKSLPGNRLKPRSVPGNRLKPGVLSAVLRAAPLTGAGVNESTLGRVPSAGHAETADRAQSAVDAQTALNAVNAVDAQTINGFEAGCLPETVHFAGACWQTSARSPMTAPQAAIECATLGGELPEALALAAFARQPTVSLAAGGEWSSDVANVTGLDLYSAVTVTDSSEINFSLSTNTRAYRCVVPVVSRG